MTEQAVIANNESEEARIRIRSQGNQSIHL